MKRAPVWMIAAVLLAVAASPVWAQSAPVSALTGTWTLVSVEENAGAETPTRTPNPRGLLVLDAAGMIFEAATRLDWTRPTEDNKALTDAQRVFATYSGFWGRYKLDPQAKTLTARAEGAVSPSIKGREVTRRFAVEGDRLTLTSAAPEPHQRGITRWVWERVPVVENLSPGYRKVVGFWQHVVEKRVNLTLKTETATTRAPSIIVYTPSGYVGVYFPPISWGKPFAGAEPTDAEARDALRGYVAYFGALGCIPARCSTRSSAASARRGRDAEAVLRPAPSGDEVNLRFPVGRNQQGQETTTLVTMKRLSGERTCCRGEGPPRGAVHPPRPPCYCVPAARGARPAAAGSISA